MGQPVGVQIPPLAPHQAEQDADKRATEQTQEHDTSSGYGESGDEGTDKTATPSKHLKDASERSENVTCRQQNPDLARVVGVWYTLPEPIRRAILALVESVERNRFAVVVDVISDS